MTQASRPHRFTARTKLIERMEARLRAQSWPRFQMALIVAFTGLAGFCLLYTSYHA